MTAGEKAAFTVRMNTIKEARLAAEEQRHVECRERAGEPWGMADDVDAGHPYIVAEGIKAQGIRQSRESLVMPVRDTGDVLQGLQFIRPDGGKKFLTGTAVQGSYLAIGKPNGAVLGCEGYATGATLHEITGRAACQNSPKDCRPSCGHPAILPR